MEVRKKTDWNSCILFIAALLMRAVCYWEPITQKFRPDDFGPLVYPAYLAGYDWSVFLSGTNFYYGFGYYWIFAPLFRLLPSAKALLAAIVAVNGVMVALSSVLLYHLLVRYFSFPRRLSTAFFALVPTMFQGEVAARNAFWYRTDNELPLYLVCWLIVWMLVRTHKNCRAAARVRVPDAVGMSLLLCWGLTVHERIQALLLAVVAVELLLFLLKRKWLFQPVAFFGSLAVGFAAQRFIRSMVIRALWAGGKPGKNLSAFSLVSMWFIKSFGAFKSFMLILLGNLHTFMISGFGLPAFAMVIVVLWLFRQLPILGKRKIAGDEEGTSEWIDPAVLVMMVFGICAMITIAGLAVRWGTMLFEGLAANQVVYGYKGLNYARYYYAFIGPVLFGLFAYCRNHLQFKRSWIEAAWGTLGAIELLFFIEVYPYCIKADATVGTTYAKRALGTSILVNRTTEIRMAAAVFFMVMAMLLATGAVRVSGEKIKRGIRFLTAGVVFLALIFALDRVSQISLRGPSLKMDTSTVVAEAILELSREDKLPETVYLPGQNWSYTVQFVNKDLEFYFARRIQGHFEEDNLVFRSKDSGRFLEEGYELVMIGRYRAYTNNPETAEALREFVRRQEGGLQTQGENSEQTEDVEITDVPTEEDLDLAA